MNRKILVLVGILAIILLVGGILLFLGKRKVQEISAQPSQQKQQETNKTNEGESEKMFDEQGRELVWYEIPELNVRFRSERRITDKLKYRYELGEKYENALFYSDELVQIPGCDILSGPLGTFTKLKGSPTDYEVKEYLESGNPKQFDGFFIVFNGPQAPCAGKGYENEWERYFERNAEMNGWSSGVLERLEIMAEN